MKKIIYIVITMFLANICLSQTYKNYTLSDIGYIYIPQNMELRSNNLNSDIDNVVKNYSNNRIVFQQKGLNNIKQNNSTYARIILKTDIGNYGDYNKLTTPLQVSQNELNEINNYFKGMMISNFIGTSMKLVKWYGTSIVQVNGMSALKISYLRQLKNNPYVVVSMYQFFNNDRIHTLTLSYRQSEKTIWQQLLSKALNSFTITNIR